MPNGPQGLDFEPQEKPPEQKKIPWRRVYGVDEEVIPTITGEKKPEDADRYGDNSNMGGPDRNGARDRNDTGMPEGTFPKPGEVFADDVDKEPSYHVGRESKSEQQARELSEVINGRSRIKPDQRWMAGVGGAITIPVANLGFPVAVDKLTHRAAAEGSGSKFHGIAKWAQSAYVPEHMKTAQSLIFGNTRIQAINSEADDALRAVNKIIEAGGQSTANAKHLDNMKSVLETSLDDRVVRSTADDVLRNSSDDIALYSKKVAADQLTRARGLNFAGVNLTSVGDDAVKVAGDDVLRIMADRKSIITNAQKEAHRIGANPAHMEQTRQGQMWSAVKLTAGSLLGTYADGKLRGTVNSILQADQPTLRDSQGRPLPKANIIAMGEQESGIKNLAIPLAFATHSKGNSWRTAGALAVASGGGMVIDHAIKSAGMEDLSDDAWKRSLLYTGTGAGLGYLASGNGKGRTKAALTGLAIGGGMDVLARTTGMNSLTPDSWKRTGLYDGVALGAGFAVPAKNWKVRAGTVAASFVIGNMFESALSSTARGDINPDIEKAMKETGETKTDRSETSLNEALSAWNKVGSRSIAAEGVAFQQFRAKDAYSRNNSPEKWNSLTPGEQLDNRRELAILSRTLGETRLNGGTKISYSSSDAEYKLKGMRVDLGGYALEKLLVSQSFANDAIRLTRQLDGQKVNGETVNAADEVRALQEFTRDTQERIDEITGVSPKEAAERRAKGIDTHEEFTKPRDMQQILNQLEHEYRKGTGIDKFFNQILTDTQYRVGAFLPLTQSEGGRKLVAKLLRDEATIKMGMAQYQMNSGVGNNAVIMLAGTAQDRDLPFRVPQVPGRARMPEIRDGDGNLMKKGYAGAKGALDLAKALDPDNPELKELQRMYDHMFQHAQKVRAGQLSDSRYNPLEVEPRTLRTKDPVYRSR